ncbi:MAG: hypothetical protein K9G46_09805 [Flavobacteriales bacterium]|jgi:putative transposase|nr:hypothetical protein [Flavobacteriales bacterium]
MADLFRNKYRIPSARAPWWDYGRDAAYFVTICTKNREHYFGEVVGDEMQLTEIGQIAYNRWHQIPNHFPLAHLDVFVVMPNHVHGIVVIDALHATPVQTLQDVQTLHATSLPPSQSSSSVETLHATSLPPNKNEKMAAISPQPGSLSTIIRSYKSAVSKDARAIHANFAWQTRFHDHIIRTDHSFERIQHYILSNPLLWHKDTFYPDNQ